MSVCIVSISDCFSAISIFSLDISFAYIDALFVSSDCIASTLAYAFCSLTSMSIFSSSQSFYPAVYGLLFLNSSLNSDTRLSKSEISLLSLSTSSVSFVLKLLFFKADQSSRFSVLSFSSSSIPSLALWVSLRVFSNRASNLAITFSYFLIVSLYRFVFYSSLLSSESFLAESLYAC